MYRFDSPCVYISACLVEDPDPTAKNSQNTRPEKKSAMYIDIDNDACSVWQSVGFICAGKPGPQIMLFAGVRARGSTPDYPDVEHETLCGCLCVCVCVCTCVCVVLFLYGHPERAVLMNF